jgi:hypothetical protein
MLSGMICRNRNAFAVLGLISCIGFLSESEPLAAATVTESPLATQSTPGLKVRVYGFPGLSQSVLHEAYTEAARMLHPLSIDLEWVDCNSVALSIECKSPQLLTDLTVHVVAKARPPATASALGLTAWSDGDGAAFVFYDRVIAMRTHTILLSSILGRVMAHEITHLLLPQHDHSEVGLMRAQWTSEDLRIASSARLELPPSSAELMRQEALRRVLGARDSTLR